MNHIFVLILENEGFSTSFAANSPAPYLAKTLPAMGALVKNYYGIGHASNDNYVAMISGQGPNPDNQADCILFSDFAGTPPIAQSDGQAAGLGCVFPTGTAGVPSLPDQLKAKNLSWKAYMEDMGNTPSRDNTDSTPAGPACGHPAVNSQDGTQSGTATDNYATRHNPFVYFHSVIDDKTYCDQHVVSLTQQTLEQDLSSVATTPNFVFITPNLCHDGHDATCTNSSQNGGLKGVNDFLTQWVPKILASPAYQQDGLLIITFDEASTSDTTACCGETAPEITTPQPGITGPGGGMIGAVLLSPYITPGTTSNKSYNHYSMLRSIEDLLGLQYLGYAGNSAQASFGPDVFTGTMPAFPSKN